MSQTSNSRRRDKTPDSRSANIHGPTPRIDRTNGDKKDITSLRPFIIAEMTSEFLTCALEIFMKTYLPFNPSHPDLSADIEACVEALVEAGHIVKVAGKYRFSEFQGDPRSTIKPSELHQFKPLQAIGDVLARCQIGGRSLRYAYYCCPNTKIQSDIAGSNNQIDGCFRKAFGPVDPRRKVPLRIADIGAPHEYKTSFKDAGMYDNNEKVVSANVQIMNDDARRMHSNGLTIEADHMRLWFFSRSHSVTSERFNFYEDPILLIKIFISFMFATDEEMGYDPTVTRHDNGQYTYEIPPSTPNDSTRFFRTLNNIVEYRSNNITGRMPRIWQVEEVASRDPDAEVICQEHRVLKDVWLELKAKTERQIQDSIFRDIKSFLSSPLSDEFKFKSIQTTHAHLLEDEKFRRYFMTIEADYEGAKTKQFPQEKIRRERQLFKTPTEIKDSTHTGTRHTQGTFHDMDSASSPIPEIRRRFSAKKQYRVVFAEVCTTVADLKTLGEVVDVMAQALIALQLMFCAGWVHRDISAGNILAFAASEGVWAAKLSDLEYAKKFPPAGCNRKTVKDPKTGTPYFMPHEILDRCYLSFLESEPKNTVDDFDNSDTSENEQPDTVMQHTPDLPVVLPVIHNYQHDLESAWWIVFWTLTKRSTHLPAQKYGQNIFLNTVQLSFDRRQALLMSIEGPLNKYLPEPAHSLIGRMERLRKSMLNAYRHRSKDQAHLDPESYITIHAHFQKAFGSLPSNKSNWRGVELTVRPRHTPTAPGRKRPISSVSGSSSASYKQSSSSNSASESSPLSERVTRSAKRPRNAEP